MAASNLQSAICNLQAFAEGVRRWRVLSHAHAALDLPQACSPPKRAAIAGAKNWGVRGLRVLQNGAFFLCASPSGATRVLHSHRAYRFTVPDTAVCTQLAVSAVATGKQKHDTGGVITDHLISVI